MRRVAVFFLATCALTGPGHSAKAGPTEPVAKLESSLPSPSPCSFEMVGGRPVFQWTASSGAQGYRVYADGMLVVTLPARYLSFGDPVPGKNYCVEAFAGVTNSSQCCQLLQGPSPCAVGPIGGGFVKFQWTAAPMVDGYNINRDGSLIATVQANKLFFVDAPSPGSHEYCVDALASGVVTGQCCQPIQLGTAPPNAPGPCSATTNLVGGIRVTWTNVAGIDGYIISRDGQQITTVSKDSTSFLDGVTGSHHYCVTAFNTFGSSAPCCSDGNGIPASMQSRLSWGTCSPQINNQNFSGPGAYTLVLSAVGSATTNAGHDAQLRIRPAVPDAWRFDDNGCQTGSRLNLQVASLGDSCPAMLGTNPLMITSYFIDVDGSAALRLAVAYDDLQTVANQRYVLWKIGFDHMHSIAGSDADPSTCDNASVPLNFSMDFTTILLTSGFALDAPRDPGDQPAYWNGGQVPTRTMTWGQIKALYH